MTKTSATAIGALLAAALLSTACEDKEPEATKAPEKTEKTATKNDNKDESAKKPAADKGADKKDKTAEKKDDTVAAKEDKAGANDKDAKAKKKEGKEDSCGEGVCS